MHFDSQFMLIELLIKELLKDYRPIYTSIGVFIEILYGQGYHLLIEKVIYINKDPTYRIKVPGVDAALRKKYQEIENLCRI